MLDVLDDEEGGRVLEGFDGVFVVEAVFEVGEELRLNRNNTDPHRLIFLLSFFFTALSLHRLRLYPLEHILLLVHALQVLKIRSNSHSLFLISQ